MNRQRKRAIERDIKKMTEEKLNSLRHEVIDAAAVEKAGRMFKTFTEELRITMRANRISEERTSKIINNTLRKLTEDK